MTDKVLSRKEMNREETAIREKHLKAEKEYLAKIATAENTLPELVLHYEALKLELAELDKLLTPIAEAYGTILNHKLLEATDAIIDTVLDGRIRVQTILNTKKTKTEERIKNEIAKLHSRNEARKNMKFITIYKKKTTLDV